MNTPPLWLRALPLLFASATACFAQNHNPTSTIRANVTSLNVGGQVVISVDAADVDGDLRYLNIDEISPNAGYYGAGYTTGTENPPGGSANDLGANYGSFTRNLTLTIGTAGTYTFRGMACDSNGSGWQPSSNILTVAVSDPTGAARITTQPQDQIVNAGSAATLTVLASGAAPISYQWRKNGTPIAGATNASLSFASAQATDAAAYDVAIRNATGFATSNPATLAVIVAASRPIVTMTPPGNHTITVGQTLSFSTIATAGDATLQAITLSYQDPAGHWNFDPTPASGLTYNGNNTYWFNNTTSNVYSASLTANTAGTYHVVWSGLDSQGWLNGTTYDLVVTSANVAPTIATQPQPQTVSVGGGCAFSVVPSGTYPFTYQWLKNGTAITGATAAILTLPNVQSADGANYSVTVSNAAGSVTSSAAALTVSGGEGGGTAPTITASPTTQIVNAGTNVSLSVTATGSTPMDYQWRLNGTPVAGATTATLSLTNIQTTAAGDYDVVVRNSAGQATSAIASVAVIGTSGAPTVTLTPGGNHSIVNGQSIRFSSQAVDPQAKIEAHMFFWTDPDGHNSWDPSSGTATGLTFDQSTDSWFNDTNNSSRTILVTAGRVGTFQVKWAALQTGIGWSYSPTYNLVVTSAASAPTIATQPQSTSVAIGLPATFTVGANGTFPFTYQWSKAGTAITGATSATLTIPNVQSGDAGSYTVTVTNTAGSVTSSSAGLNNGSAPTMTIVSGNNQTGVTNQFNVQPFDVAVWNSAGTQPLVGTAVTFTVQSGGGLLATTNTGSPQTFTSLTLNTDADGTAQVFYKQPASAGILSQIIAASGGAQVTFSTTSAAPGSGPTTPPNAHAVTSTPTSISFAWSSSVPGGGGALSGYYIYRNGTQLNGTPQMSQSYVDSTASGGTTYTYTIKAVDASGNLSNAASLTIAAPASSTSGTFEVYTPTL